MNHRAKVCKLPGLRHAVQSRARPVPGPWSPLGPLGPVVKPGDIKRPFSRNYYRDGTLRFSKQW